MRNDSNGNIRISTANVNRLRAVRQASGLNPRQMVGLLKESYPRYDKTLQSKCEHTDDYGVQLAESTLKALERQYGIRRPAENRTKPHRITVRFEKGQYSLLQRALKVRGISAQSYALRGIMKAVTIDLEGIK